jgi:hypothetical protein
MAENLTQYLDEHPCQGFNPVPHYFAEGDFVTYYFRGERSYAQRVDDLLTVYRTFDTHELVGCKLKGVRQILKTAGAFNVAIADGQVRLALFFFVGAASARTDAQRIVYEELRRAASEAALGPEDYQAALSG